MIQGMIYAGLAAVLSGSFAVLPKYALQQAQRKQTPIPHPVTSWWLALGFVCVSTAWAVFIRQAFSWWGLLSGLLWALSVVGRVACIGACGMATGNATPDITTALTAWAYDALYNHQTFTCRPLGLVGYLLLALCLVSIYVLEQQGHIRRQLLVSLQNLSTHAQADHSTHAAPPLVEPPAASDEAGRLEDAAAAADSVAVQLTCPLMGHPGQHGHATSSDDVAGSWGTISWGLVAGALSGICSGLSQLPFTLVPAGCGGIHFILASSLGMLLFATVNVYLHRWLWCREGLVSSIKHPDMHAAAMGPYGILGGAVLLASMVCSILAGQDPAVEFAGAKVIAEGSILVSGAWGVLLFHELRSLLQVLFWLLSLQMLCAYAVIVAARVIIC